MGVEKITLIETIFSERTVVIKSPLGKKKDAKSFIVSGWTAIA